MEKRGRGRKGLPRKKLWSKGGSEREKKEALLALFPHILPPRTLSLEADKVSRGEFHKNILQMMDSMFGLEDTAMQQKVSEMHVYRKSVQFFCRY